MVGEAHDFILGLAQLRPIDVDVGRLHLREALHGLPKHDGGRGQGSALALCSRCQIRLRVLDQAYCCETFCPCCNPTDCSAADSCALARSLSDWQQAPPPAPSTQTVLHSYTGSLSKCPVSLCYAALQASRRRQRCDALYGSAVQLDFAGAPCPSSRLEMHATTTT
jgi:hypothetical protein